VTAMELAGFHVSCVKVLQAASECNRLKPRACRSDDRGKRGGGVGAEEGVVSQ